MNISVDALYAIRADCLVYLSELKQLKRTEVCYEDLQQEVYKRLLNNDLIAEMPFERFKRIFAHTDYQAETTVQFKNKKLISYLAELKEKGYAIYLLSDFHLPYKLIVQLLTFHGMAAIFDDVFVSCSLGKSKERGNLYPYVLEETQQEGSNVIMMGDHKISDVKNALKYNLQAYHLPHQSHKWRNRKNLFGTDSKTFIKKVQTIENQCRKSDHPFSEYIIFFYFFTERLYERARRDGRKNLFFLAREGLYLKKLFDEYQVLNQGLPGDKIQTHYLKASRQSAMLVALKPLNEEAFAPLLKRYKHMSLAHFLDFLLFPEKVKDEIVAAEGIDQEQMISHFLKSEVMVKLRNNEQFKKQYEINRHEQKKAFTNYFAAFDATIENEGIALVDVGWGGTMQENIYHFFEEKIPVTGYYMGLKEIYDIQPDTKRYGLNFSIYPHYEYTDHILMANGNLYEQLLGASHGTTLGYKDDLASPTIEFHEENEKRVFDNLAAPIQDYMFTIFKDLFHELRSVNYTHALVQYYITKLALRTGIFMTRKKLKFIHKLSQGFFQNIGDQKVGLTFDPQLLEASKMSLLKTFLWAPEKVFRYLVKIQPMRYSQGKYTWSWAVNLSFYYMRLNRFLKKTWFKKNLLN